MCPRSASRSGLWLLVALSSSQCFLTRSHLVVEASVQAVSAAWALIFYLAPRLYLWPESPTDCSRYPRALTIPGLDTCSSEESIGGRRKPAHGLESGSSLPPWRSIAVCCECSPLRRSRQEGLRTSAGRLDLRPAFFSALMSAQSLWTSLHCAPSGPGEPA